jgi:leucyl-tRNA synthetase
MGKSKGNVITLADIKRKYSADLFRFYISHGADLNVVFNFLDKEIKAIQNNVEKFFTFLSDKIIQSNNIVAKYEDIKSSYTKVVLSKIIKKFTEADKALEQFNIRRYIQISFYEIFNLVQGFYREVDDKSDFSIVIKIIYPDWLRILSPTMPHLCEELWEIAGNKGFISTETWSTFKEIYIKNDLEIEFKYIMNVIEDILNIKQILKNQESNKIYLYTAPEWKLKVLDLINSKKDDFNSIISELKETKELMSNKNLIPYLKNQLKDRAWEKELPQVDEISLLEQYKSYIEKRVNLVIIINSEYDPKQRSKKALPFKPGIYFEG